MINEVEAYQQWLACRFGRPFLKDHPNSGKHMGFDPTSKSEKIRSGIIFISLSIDQFKCNLTLMNLLLAKMKTY